MTAISPISIAALPTGQNKPAGRSSLRFGVRAPEPPVNPVAAQPVKQLGLIKAGRILVEHVKHAENREQLNAMSQYFLPRFAKYGTALIPFGFLLAYPVDKWSEGQVSQGRQKIDTLIAAGKLKPDDGPLGCAMQIEKNWRVAIDKKGHLSNQEAHGALTAIKNNWNKMMGHLFPDDQDGISLVREKLKMSEESRRFHYLARAFHANRDPKVRFFKNFAKKANGPVLGIILKPIRWLMLGIGLLVQGLEMTKNGPAVQKMLGQTIRRMV